MFGDADVDVQRVLAHSQASYCEKHRKDPEERIFFS